MNCRNVQSLLSAYVDGELTGQQMLAIRQHTDQCGECQQEVSEMRLLKSLLANTPVVAPSADFESRLVEAVFSIREPEKTSFGQSFTFLAGVSLAAAAFTLLVLNFLASAAEPPQNSGGSIALVNDQTSLTAADPFGGTPVVHSTYGQR